MNKLKAQITDIKSIKDLNSIKFDFHGSSLSMVALDLDENIKIGSSVLLSAKATHIAIAKDFSGELSYSNQLKAKIVDINKGEILTSIKAITSDTLIESIITTNSAQRMQLKNPDEIVILIKATELFITEVLG